MIKQANILFKDITTNKQTVYLNDNYDIIHNNLRESKFISLKEVSYHILLYFDVLLLLFSLSKKCAKRFWNYWY